MTVYLVGAGPGAPDLLTLRAARLLEQADIVFYDALVHPDTIALAKEAQKFPVGKRCGKHSTAQQFINKRLVDAAKRYGVVVRLKGGDPMMFGRAQEEIAALEEAGIACEVVPGITAALAAAAQIKTSLTQRGSARSITFATPRVGASEPDSTWIGALAAADAGAIYMGHFVAQREKLHSNLLGLHVSGGNWITDQNVHAMTAGLYAKSSGMAAAGARAIDLIAARLRLQAYSLSIIDGFLLIAWSCACALIFVALLRRSPLDYGDLSTQQEIPASAKESK